MPLRLFNSLTRKKEVFKPARGKTARFYSCGPTVYDYVHIGNLRTFIFEDVLYRALALNGYKVKMVMNITDIDDKTIRGAKKAGKALKGFTDFYAGGVDLIFPHHENEIAQSEAAFGKKFARFFVEGEHLKVEGKKMSKSLGNLLTFRDLERKGFDPLDFRYLTLTAHYRSPLSFSW